MLALFYVIIMNIKIFLEIINKRESKIVVGYVVFHSAIEWVFDSIFNCIEDMLLLEMYKINI